MAVRDSGGAIRLMGASLWAGLVVGLLDVGMFVARVHLAQHGLYRRSPHVLWMIPVANLAIFGTVGLLLLALIRPIPRFGHSLSWWVLGIFGLTASFVTIPGLRLTACLLLAVGIASWVAPSIQARRNGGRRLVLATLPPLVLAVIALGGIAYGQTRTSRGGPTTGAGPKGAPNVVMIVMDTVRADATSLGGSARDTTPRLTALANRGARFDRAIATCPWTLPSHASMVTGMMPSDLDLGPDRGLDSRYPTLAEYLGQNGYETAGFVANMSFCTKEYGLSRGFGHYQDYVISPFEAIRSTSLGWLISRRLVPVLDRLYTTAGREASHPLESTSHRKDAAQINREALGWIGTQRDRPFFAFLNYMDAHAPYLVPKGAPQPFMGRPVSIDERRTLRDWIDETPRPRSPDAIRLARDAYDDCIAALDTQIGHLVDELGRLGQLENTVILITSDHGEHFGEHVRDGLPLLGHRLSVYQAEVHVPLLIVAPGRLPGGTVVSRAVSLRDLPATMVDLVGLRDGSPFPGQSLFPPQGIDPGRAALAEFSPEQETCHGPTDNRMRALVVEGESYHRHGNGGEELYDLANDPGESNDLADFPVRRDLLGELRASLDAILKSN
jgi:arylsulfatase A-like enzyme